MAEAYLKLKKPKDSLKSFKMVLFLNPNHKKAQTVVKKLESLTADEYDADLFEMKPLASPPPTTRDTHGSGANKNWPSTDPSESGLQSPNPHREESPHQERNYNEASRLSRQLDRCLSLIDAYIARNDQEKAIEAAKSAARQFPQHPEVQRRLKILQLSQIKTQSRDKKTPFPTLPPYEPDTATRSINELNKLLEQIQERRHEI